jgi:hypothetical protein
MPLRQDKAISNHALHIQGHGNVFGFNCREHFIIHFWNQHNSVCLIVDCNFIQISGKSSVPKSFIPTLIKISKYMNQSLVLDISASASGIESPSGKLA